mgnify:FL=1|jgi:hypothetical protein
MGTKYKENRSPPEKEILRWMMAKLEVNSATVLPIIKKGTPAQIKKVITNNTAAITANMKFFLSTLEQIWKYKLKGSLLEWQGKAGG